LTLPICLVPRPSAAVDRVGNATLPSDTLGSLAFSRSTLDSLELSCSPDPQLTRLRSLRAMCAFWQHALPAGQASIEWRLPASCTALDLSDVYGDTSVLPVARAAGLESLAVFGSFTKDDQQLLALLESNPRLRLRWGHRGPADRPSLPQPCCDVLRKRLQLTHLLLCVHTLAHQQFISLRALGRLRFLQCQRCWRCCLLSNA
jgi:hypothetical protein